MNQTFTLTQLTEFTLREKQLLGELVFLPKQKDEFPSENIVDFLLSYSKALSVRKSERFGALEMLLN